ncbi:uncharacterized protein LOC142974888 [Anticarsia gemmatalis]|uniref:uncharacterized protein LOC142974888 n=1 Tax=Anticarsia gemmatalis TaxID=129554 RepID=UPI003F7730B5
MKTYGFLIIILGFIQIVFCNHDLNITDDLYSQCPVQFFRRKRALGDYTRWGANQATTNEFLVKVLDEELTTSNTQKIVAINIMPLTEDGDRIIIGGVSIPSPTTLMSTTVETRDYTRFVPPTTTPSPIEERYIAPVSHGGIATPNSVLRSLEPRGNNLRDDSPPASPQFIARTPTLVARQYAPVEPVAFAHRTSIAPLTPPTIPQIFSVKDIQRRNEKDETSYNMMFYNDEDTISGKKEDQESADSEYDKKDLAEDVAEDFSDSRDAIDDVGNKNISSGKELQHYLDDYVTENTTNKTVTKGIVGIPGIEIATINNAVDKSREKRRPYCNLLKLRQLNFNSPRTLPEIIHQLKVWAEDSPVAKWVDITSGNFTTMENPIYMMIVDDPSSGQIVTAKQTVMIVAGIQGRDHHAVAAAMYVLYQLIERSDAHTDLLTKYRFWVIPVFNPDGYDYSMTFPHRREWAKNLHQSWDACRGREPCKYCESHGLRCTIQPCYGVNLDRNFEYQWIPVEDLRAEHPCGGLYAGPRQLSEAETRALTQFLHEQRTPLFTFIAFKEGDVLRQRASRAASAAYSISNRPYIAGQTSEFLPLYAGGIEDWVDGHLGIDNTYTIMMFRPTDSYSSKLITERVVHETYAALDTLLLQSLEPLSPAMPPVTITRASASESAAPQRLLYLITIFLILLLNG